MANTVIIGTQWGDEGKGKVVDFLAPRYDWVIRFQGGPNAGHSVVFDGARHALHVLPSGVFHPNTVNLIANGVVVNPNSLVEEIRNLRAKGVKITPENLKISDRAHMIMPYHGLIDRFRESQANLRKIGTTGRGIGPVYEWKMARKGLRFCDLKHKQYLHRRIAEECAHLATWYPETDELKKWGAEATMKALAPAFDFLEPFVVDGVSLLNRARKEAKSLLFEGAQATLLDVDFGTYPYVTSSNACAVGVTAGAGVPPTTVDHVIGIVKAYSTRVGEGPMPTELEDGIGQSLREAGDEFGTTTGRPRRCGWLDLVALRYACRLNACNSLALMKLDVLDHLDEIKLCTSYLLDGEEIDYFPASPIDVQRLQPRYKTLPGWRTSLAGVKDAADLPREAASMIEFVEEWLECGFGLVSVGPDRGQTIIKDRRFFG